MRIVSLFALISLHCLNSFSQTSPDIETYRTRYGLNDVSTKLVDNIGNGYEDLYGVRNFRVVLHGVYYRGGANNKYHRTNKRPNMNPLPNDGLMNLCEEGFSKAIYFYDTNFNSAPKVTKCKNGTLNYEQLTAFEAQNEKKFLTMIFQKINQQSAASPIYAHCWNGWHASGLMAAQSLQQFCGLTPAQALAYWIKNTDGNSSGYDSIKKRITNFKPYSDLKISAEMKRKICPEVNL